MTPERLAELRNHAHIAEGRRCMRDQARIDDLSRKTILELATEVERLQALINNPHIDDFLEAVRLEAAHQRERWGDAHDAGKSDEDFYWTLGWLAGKGVRFENQEKRLHHIITSAALCLNWHRHAQASGGERLGEKEAKPLNCPDCNHPVHSDFCYEKKTLVDSPVSVMTTCKCPPMDKEV